MKSFLLGAAFAALTAHRCFATDYSDTIKTNVGTWENSLATLTTIKGLYPTGAGESGLHYRIYAEGDFAVACDLAVRCMIYGWGGQPSSYLDAIATDFDDFIATDKLYLDGHRADGDSANGALITKLSFFVPYPLTLAYTKLKAAGKVPLGGARQLAMQDFVTNRFYDPGVPSPFPDDLNNSLFSRAAGYELAYQQSELAAPLALHTFAQAAWAKFVELQDVPEDSTQYIGISSAYMWILGDLLGTGSDINNSSTHAMVTRLRDQLSPAGQMATYGDSFDASTDSTWPVDLDWGYHLYAFERAAHGFGVTSPDPSFRWASAQIAATGYSKEPFNSYFRSIMPMMFYALAYDVATAGGTPPSPVAPVVSSGVQIRNYESLPATPTSFADKIILSPSRASLAPFALFELFAPFGYHTHQNQSGSVLYYQWQNQTLLDCVDGNLRGADSGNLVLMRQSGDSFPVRTSPGFIYGQAYTSAMPLRSVRWFGADSPRTFTNLALLSVVSAGKKASLAVSDIRLLGVGGASTIVDHCSVWPDPEGGLGGTAGWIMPSGVTGATATVLGRTVIVFTLDNSAGTLSRAFEIDKAFDTGPTAPLAAVNMSTYQNLALDWVPGEPVAGVPGLDQARPFLFRFRDSHLDALNPSYGAYSTDFYPVDAQLGAALDVNNASQSSSSTGYRLADMRFTNWFTSGTVLHRRAVMDPYGAMLVRDDLVLDSAAVGQQLGQVWNLGPLGSPNSGTQWIDSTGGTNNLMIYFKNSAGAAAATATYDAPNGRTISAGLPQIAAYSKATVTAASPMRFNSALIPHVGSLSSTDAGTMAGNVTLTDPGSGSTGRTTLSYKIGTTTYHSHLDVLNDDGVSSVVEIGDQSTGATQTVIARTPTSVNTLQSNNTTTTDGNDVQLDYAAGTTVPLYWDAIGVQNLKMGTSGVQPVFVAVGARASAAQFGYLPYLPAAGSVTVGSALSALTLYAPAAIPSQATLRVDGTPVTTYTYSATAHTVQFAVSSGTHRIALAEPNLLQHWNLDDATGSGTADDVGHHDGTLMGTTLPAWNASGKFGGALSFSGINWVRSGSNAGVTAYPFTISAWVRTTNSTAAMSVADLVDSSSTQIAYEIGIHPGGLPSLIVWNTGSAQELTSTAAVADGNWHLIVGVFASATSRTIYVDNAAGVGTTGTSVLFAASVNRFAIGALDLSPSASRPYAGDVDDVRIYNRTLSASDVLSLYPH